MVAHNGFTYDLTDTQKAQNLVARLEKALSKERAQTIVTHLLDKWGEINSVFVRNLGEIVFDAEQETYSHTEGEN